MYLKRLELQGFKSFADKTVLDFGQGVTTVVGPNGSGKSNISDAVRWVMGEMSAKSLRGANMQDVIFSGTQTRKQVNFAEVSLVLDNSDRLFPLDYEEIVVTRKVFRSGESVYQINHSDCRLKDIHELFMDTGLGRDGYSMIGQGNVSKILSTKAEDRRSFFEEAAGVSKYKHRKDEAQRKLASVEDNLVRINDITAELERQLGPLENQSKKARKYLVLYEEYKGLDVSMSLVNLEKNSELTKKTEELMLSVNDEIEQLRSKETEIEAKRNELYLKSSQKDEEQSRKNNDLIDNEAKSMICSNDISISQNDIKNNNSLIERIDSEIADFERKNIEAESQIKVLEKSISAHEDKKKNLLSDFENIQNGSDEINQRLLAYQEEIEKLKTDVIEKMNEISSQKARIQGIEALRASFIERRETVTAELKKHGEGIENTKAELKKAEATILEKSEKLDAMKKRVERLVEKIDALLIEIREATDKISNLTVSLNSKTSQKKILEGMENDYEGFSRSVKSVMTAQELKNTAIYGTVSGLIDVERKYVVAIETALGGAMQNIVVESEEDAKRAISYLKNTKSGRATFLPISSVNGKGLDNVNEIKKCNGFIGIASELIGYDKKYEGVVKSLLGRTVVADNIDDAVEIARKFSYKFKIVTVEGEVLNSGGSISGGSVNKSSGFLSRATQIKELSADISELTKQINDFTKKKEEQERDLANLQSQHSDYMPMSREYENDILVAQNNIEHLKNVLSNSDTSHSNLADELTQIEVQLTSSADEVAKFIGQSRSLERSIEEINLKISEKEEEYQSVIAEKEEKADRMMEEALQLKSVDNDILNDKKAIDDLLALIEENKKTIANDKADKDNLILKNSELEKHINEKNNEIEEIKLISQKIKSEIEQLEADKQAIVEGLKGITNSNKDLTDRLMTLQQEMTRLEAKLIKYQEDSENIITRLWDEYELTQSSAEDIKLEISDVAETRKNVAELKGKIKALGSVNLDSIDEYVSTKERFDFLSTQKTDLEESQSNLYKVIDSMQELMEEHFQKQFEEINKAFSRVFNELFGGGRGRLYLSEPSDIMESGIEIEVQLPGKGLQNINLYSGGEKSFIAIALLFAILEVKPTPFCFLDEIDAALDDVNVSRFATYLKNYLNATQFIVITHRRGTMEASNIMYGVTMQEKGVSKLLSLQIDDVNEELLGE